MKKISLIAAIVFAVVFLSSCGSVKMGRDFEVAGIAGKIEQGVTTQDMVRSWLGEPSSTGESLDTGGERFDEWVYYFAEGELPGMSTAKLKILQIKFDKQGKVRSYYWTASRQ